MKKKRPQKQHWIQKTHIFRTDIFVSTGMNAKEMQRTIKRYGVTKWMSEWVDKVGESWQRMIDAGCAFVSREPSHGAIILRLREYQDSWDFWETLIHEITHIVDGLGSHRGFDDEMEASAYLHEWLFHEIRRKLQGVVPKNSDTA